MKKYTIIPNIIFSILFIHYYNLLFFTSSNHIVHTHNIITLPIFLGIYYVLSCSVNYFYLMNIQKWVFILLGFLYSLLFLFGTHIQLHGAVTLTASDLWISLLVFTYVITAFLLFLYYKIFPIIKDIISQANSKLVNFFYNKTSFLNLWCMIFICWLPIFIICYPGIFSYDAINQSSQIGESIHLNAHHPILHTLFLGGCVHLGRSLFDSPNIGMAIYSLLQMLINSAIFAYCLTYIKKWCSSAVIFLFTTIFFIFIPFNPLFSICATKDALFGPLFLLLFIFICKLTLNTEEFFYSKKNICSFAIVTFVLLILRNNMIYAFIASIPFFVFIYRQHLKSLLIILVLPLILLELYQNILYPALNVTPGNSREAYSVIMQQFASVYNYGEINEEEKKLLLELMTDSDWKKYEPRRADAVKDNFNTEVFEYNIATYIKLWLRLGFKNPSQYINAFLNLTYGYWYPNDILPDTTTYRKYIEVYCSGEISFDSKFPWLLYQIQKFGMESSYQRLPVISMLFSPGFYIWILLYLSASNFYNKKIRYLSLVILPFTLFLTLLLGPVALLRYLYPIILCTPIFLIVNHKL